MRLAQSVMELHHETLGTRWWPFHEKSDPGLLDTCFYVCESSQDSEFYYRWVLDDAVVILNWTDINI